jgi:Lipase (class 3)
MSDLALINKLAYQPATTAIPSGYTLVPIEGLTLATPGLTNPIVLRDSSGNIVIAFRGTDPNSSADRQADINIINGVTPDPARDALAFVRAVAEEFKSASITVTGHSLGGYEAQYSIAKLQNEPEYAPRNISAVTFNSPALLPQDIQSGVSASSFHVLNVVSSGDWVSAYTEATGGIFIGQKITVPAGPTGQSIVNMFNDAAAAGGYTAAGFEAARTGGDPTGLLVLGAVKGWASYKDGLMDAHGIDPLALFYNNVEQINAGAAASLGSWGSGPTMASVMSANPQKMQDIGKALKALGVKSGLGDGGEFGGDGSFSLTATAAGYEVVEVVPSVNGSVFVFEALLDQTGRNFSNTLTTRDILQKIVDVKEDVDGDGRWDSDCKYNSDGGSDLQLLGYSATGKQYVAEEIATIADGTVIDTTYTVNPTSGETTASTTNVTLPGKTAATPATTFGAADIGSIFGSSIGQALGGKNAFAKIATGAALSTIGGTLGQTMDLYFDDAHPISFEGAMASSLNGFDARLYGSLVNAGTGALSGFLMGELDRLLGVDTTTFGGQLVNVAGNTLLNSALHRPKHQISDSHRFGRRMQQRARRHAGRHQRLTVPRCNPASENPLAAPASTR